MFHSKTFKSLTPKQRAHWHIMAVTDLMTSYDASNLSPVTGLVARLLGHNTK